MSFTTQDLEDIDRAIASGEYTVRNADGRTVTYRSMAELTQARSLVASQLAQAASPLPRAYPRYQLADFSD